MDPKSVSGAVARHPWAARCAFLAVIVVAWEIYGRSVSELLLAPPSAVLQAAYVIAVGEGTLWAAMGTTLWVLAAGFGLSVVVGVLVGVAMGRWEIVQRVCDPYVAFLYSLPPIALLPLLIIWFGIGETLRVVVVFLFAVFPVILNTATGVREVESAYLDVGRSYCASERQMVKTIVLPRSLPYIFAGVRQALAQGLVGVVVVEMAAAVTGMGGLILQGANFYRTSEMIFPIIALMVMSMAFTGSLELLLKRLSPWMRVGTEQNA